VIEIGDEKKYRVYWKDGTSFIGIMNDSQLKNMNDVEAVIKIELVEKENE